MTGQVKYLPQSSADLPDRYANTKSSSLAANPTTTIDLVRELLHGDAMRYHEQRVGKLQEAVEALDQQMRLQFADVQSSIELLASSVRQNQNAQMRRIGDLMMALGREISTLDGSHERATEKK